MARADDIIKLLRHGVNNDLVEFRALAQTMIDDLNGRKQHALADRYRQALVPTFQKQGSAGQQPMTLSGADSDLLYEETPTRKLDEVFLAEQTHNTCVSLIQEQRLSDKLLKHGMLPRHRVLLTGGPGNGKTTLAEALATELGYPLITARYEKLIGSFLGDTARRLLKTFEHAQTKRCVLFLDEFDTMGKERGDTNETGEIKRVVSSLLLQIDRLPPHVVVVGATNHPELLDKAVWRRFQVRLNLPSPEPVQIERYLRYFAEKNQFDFGVAPEDVVEDLQGNNFAELEEFCISLKRAAIINDHPDGERVLGGAIEEWKAREQTQNPATDNTPSSGMRAH